MIILTYGNQLCCSFHEHNRWLCLNYVGFWHHSWHTSNLEIFIEQLFIFHHSKNKRSLISFLKQSIQINPPNHFHKRLYLSTSVLSFNLDGGLYSIKQWIRFWICQSEKPRFSDWKRILAKFGYCTCKQLINANSVILVQIVVVVLVSTTITHTYCSWLFYPELLILSLTLIFK